MTYFSVRAIVQAELIDNILHSMPSFSHGNIGWKAEGSRKKEVLTHSQSAHYKVILQQHQREQRLLEHS